MDEKRDDPRGQRDETRRIATLSLDELISELASTNPSPGCGAAAAVTLALAAGCVAKAAAISLHHQSDQHDPGAADLREACSEALRLARRALAGAQEDADRFEALLKKDTPRASEQLRETDADLLAQCRSLEACIDRIEKRVKPNVAGDLAAARELAGAAARVHRLNLRQLPP
jgi:methenyltetrahydrofolate cyclohydrolase